MKKRLKIIIISSVVILFGFSLLYASFLAPYNLEGILNANSLGV